MAQGNAMKQIGWRHIGCCVECMEWSNRMDLIAIGTDKGEVFVQRLNWQRVVTYPTPKENVKVRSLSWQLDEAVLAVGYSNGIVSLLDIESEDVISSHTYDEDIKTVYFSKAIKVTDYKSTYRNHAEHNFEFFLPPLPALNTFGGSVKSNSEHKSFAKGTPCFLVVTLQSGGVHLLLLGALKAGSLELRRHVVQSKEFVVYDVRLSYSFDAVYALVRDGNQLKFLHFKNAILQEYISPLLHLAVHCANILENKIYLNETIQCTVEAWETVLLEMDNKLTKYAHQQSEGSLSADFLELLLFGYATDSIEAFLMDELTEKGLKKLANSVELSYANVQNLVAKPLQSAAVNMFYFLNTTKGMSRINFFYEPLLVADVAEEALRICGAFLMKVLEMQQVIDQCIHDMKLFFCWLSVVILRLHQQDVPEEITQITPEDTIYLADYLNNFEDSIVESENGTIIKRKFNLEKVGQYLDTKNLQQVVKTDVHHLWKKLLDENECLQDCTLFYPHDKNASLLQQRETMLEAIDKVFEKPNESISSQFTLNASIVCCSLPSNETGNDDFVRVSHHVNGDKQCDMFAVTTNWQEAFLIEFDKGCKTVRSTRLQLSSGPSTSTLGAALENLQFIDLQFYNEKIISFLLESTQAQHQNYYLHFPFEVVKDKSTELTLTRYMNLSKSADQGQPINALLESNNFRNMDGRCTNLAVSGSRKVATILSDQKKKITIFEMEVEEDEDETEISQHSLLDASKDSSISVLE